ncbi:MAG: putative bifunctional diguanylate cyclase/phosphodiesterase [Pseudomonadota bacterium]
MPKGSPGNNNLPTRHELDAARERIRDLEASQEASTQILEELHLHHEELRTQNEELRAAQEALREASQRYQDLFDFAPVAFFVLDPQGSIIEVNLTATDMLGIPRSGLLHQPLRRHLATVSRETFDRLLAVARQQGVQTDVELTVSTRDNPDLHVQASLTLDHREGEVYFRLAMLDLTGRHQAEEHRRLAATVFEESNEGIMITDANVRIQRVNRAFTVVTGYQEGEVLGKSPGMLSSGRHDPAFYEAMWDRLQQKGHWMGEIWNRRKNGEIYPEWLKINAVTDSEGVIQHYVGIFSDIGDHRQTGQDVERFAFYDALTDLPNRTLLQERLKHGLMRSKRDGRMLALLYMDLDNFKTINDTMGHQAGDLLLQEAAARLQQVVRPSDTVARLGGDEFTVLLSDLADEATATTTAGRVANAILQALERPFLIHDNEVVSGCSIGIAMFPRDGATCSEIAKHADIAMYQAKHQGGHSYTFFAPVMNRELERRVQLEGHLRHALDHDELGLVFQPVVDIHRQCVVGVEALLRWHSSDGPAVSPQEFIPVMESLGLGQKVAQWVLERACGTLCEWSFPGAEDLWIAVNYSPRQLQGLTSRAVQKTLEQTGLDASRLVLEATEEHFQGQAEHIVNTLHAVRELGARVALDDFGSGHSSLGRLRHLPIDIIKLDRSFVQGLPDEPRDLAIVNTVITMARQLDLSFLAEGVESHAQLGMLRSHGCELVQGFVYTRPRSGDDCAAWCADFRNQPRARAPDAAHTTHGEPH